MALSVSNLTAAETGLSSDVESEETDFPVVELHAQRVMAVNNMVMRNDFKSVVFIMGI